MKCRSKLDCLIYEMLWIKNKGPKLNMQTDSIRAKLFTWMLSCQFIFSHSKSINILLFKTEKKSSFDRPNHTSIQVFQFKISVKTKRRKQIRFDKQIFFRNFNPIRRLRVARKPVQPVLWGTNPAWHLCSFWVLFVLYEVQLDNKMHFTD